MNKKLRFSRGLAQIPLMIMLLLMAVAVPVATKLVQDNADSRNFAKMTEDECGTGYRLVQGKCLKLGGTIDDKDVEGDGLVVKNKDKDVEPTVKKVVNTNDGCGGCGGNTHCVHSGTADKGSYSCVAGPQPTFNNPNPTHVKKPTPDTGGKKCSDVSNGTECAYIPGCNWNDKGCSGTYPTKKPNVVPTVDSSRCKNNKIGRLCDSGIIYKCSEYNNTPQYFAPCVSGSCSKNGTDCAVMPTALPTRIQPTTTPIPKKCYCSTNLSSGKECGWYDDGINPVGWDDGAGCGPMPTNVVLLPTIVPSVNPFLCGGCKSGSRCVQGGGVAGRGGYGCVVIAPTARPTIKVPTQKPIANITKVPSVRPMPTYNPNLGPDDNCKAQHGDSSCVGRGTEGECICGGGLVGPVIVYPANVTGTYNRPTSNPNINGGCGKINKYPNGTYADKNSAACDCGVGKFHETYVGSGHWNCGVDNSGDNLGNRTPTSGNGGGGGTCVNQCPVGGKPNKIVNCDGVDPDGATSLCNAVGRVEVCGGKNFCCPTVGGAWTTNMAKCPTAPGACKECDKNFKCYKNGTEYKWFVNGYVMTGFKAFAETKSNPPKCGTILKPAFLGKSKGDANCDGRIDVTDYSLWHKEFFDGNKGALIKQTWNADFTGANGKCDRKVDVYDFSLWQKYFNQFNK